MATDTAFFTLFRDRWKLAADAEKAQREKELEDLLFESGEHWDAAIKIKREAEGKPCLTIDLLSGPIKHVTNQQRAARPGITITAAKGGVSPKKAVVWQGLIRRVERLSHAGRAYSWAGQYQAKMGRGFWVIRNVEVGDDGEQDIRIEEVDNQHTIYCDPTSKKLDGSDKKWAIRFEDLTHEEYKSRFGESKLAEGLSDGAFRGGVGDAPPDWITSTHCRIAEYYYLKETKRTRLILSNGDRVWEDELPTESGRVKGKFAKLPVLPDGATIVRKVVKTTTTVQWCLINGAGEELEQTTIPGQYIPVVRIYGERRNINGAVDYRGMVRMAKDPSRMEDFCESSLMETIQIAKTAPWLAEWDQISEFKTIWETSNRVNYAVLPYKRVATQGGQPIPPPQRITAGVDVAALTVAAQRMQNHVRNVTGQPDTYQEETGSVQAKLSGKAIDKRRQIQELGTSDYMEGLSDGILLTARIIISMGIEVWDTPRVMRIVGADQKERAIVVHNGQEQEDSARGMLEQGIDPDDVYDLSGSPEDFEIAISVGRSHDTMRQETVAILGEVIPMLPPPMQAVAIPIMVDNMDGPGMAELAAAIKPSDEGPKIPPEVQAHLQQADQLLQMAQQRIQELEKEQAAKLSQEQVKGMIEAALLKEKGAQALELQRLKGVIELRLQDDAQRHEMAMAGASAALAQQSTDRDDLRTLAGGNGNGGGE